MRRLLLFSLLFMSLSAAADERGVARLERIARHYADMGNYSAEFVLTVDGQQQRGELIVAGKISYMKVADSEIFVDGAVRYEVRSSAKEIILDRADIYEKELLNPANGFSGVTTDYDIVECEMDGSVALRLTPKKSGETIYIIVAPDGESIAKVRYNSGENRAELRMVRCQKGGKALPTFSKDRYKGFELIDFR